ncbi:serine protease [Candidatus Poribacteria bacterium]|nr:serine protease [Candidatus Poribacteria bacterium]
MASGFFVTRDIVVTNVHAINGSTKVSICGGHSLTKRYSLVGVTAFDTRNDLALIKVSGPGVPLPIGNLEALKKGEPVYFIGYGHNSEYNGMMGVVIDPRCNKLFQIKVKRPKDNVGPGYSGGAVLNNSGEVVGVVVSACEIENSEKSYIFVNAIPTIVLRELISNSRQVESLLTWQKRPEIRAYTKIALGSAQSEKGKYKKAISYYDCAIKLNAEYFYGFFNRALAKEALGDFSAAVSDYDTTLRLNPEFVVAYFNRALAKEALGDFRSAVLDYTQVIRLNPQYDNVYFNRGYAKGELGDYSGAILDYDAALCLSPEDVDVYYNRGYAKDELGDYRGAILDYDAAFCLSPEDADVYYNRALAIEKLGQQAASEADFKKAKEKLCKTR